MGTQRQTQRQSGQGDLPSLQHEQSLPKPLIPELCRKQDGRIMQRTVPQPAQQSSATAGAEDPRLHDEDAFDLADKP